MAYFSKDQIQAARKTDLYDFLLRCHPDAVKKEGNSLRMQFNHSISVRRGYCGYYDFATKEGGNSIDFLVRYLNYDFETAMNALSPPYAQAGLQAGNASPAKEWPVVADLPDIDVDSEDLPVKVALPEPCSGYPQRMFDYLGSRGIPHWLVEYLYEKGLVYQAAQKNNIVFLSRLKDFYELRGTVPGIPFHRCKKQASDRCWAFIYGDQKPKHAMVCECAIDAMSLYLLRLADGKDDGCTMYFGIAGVSNQKAIDRIRSYLPVTIAVDNDEAGKQCRDSNPDDPFLIPTLKDWNEDLCSRNPID